MNKKDSVDVLVLVGMSFIALFMMYVILAGSG